MAREACACFFIYPDRATARQAPRQPIGLVCLLRLSGARFDTFLGGMVLGLPGNTIDRQFYKAAKAADIAAGELWCPPDLGAFTLADGRDV